MTFHCKELKIISRPDSRVSIKNLYITKTTLLLCVNNVFRLPLGILQYTKMLIRKKERYLKDFMTLNFL